jgi:hypothetical protein
MGSGLRLTLKALDSAITGLVVGIFNSFGTDKLGTMIDHGWHTLDLLFYSMQTKPDYSKVEGMTAEDVTRAEQMRISMPTAILPLLAMTVRLARSFPPEAVEAKVTGPWLLMRAQKKRPDIAEFILSRDAGMAWLDAEAAQIRDFLLGRISWNPYVRKMVPVELLQKSPGGK